MGLKIRLTVLNTTNNKKTMAKEEIIKDFSKVINRHSIDSMLNLPDFVIAEYIIDSLDALKKMSFHKTEPSQEKDFVERMYAMYPTKCPKRGSSLGKSHKDKQRIKNLLKMYSMEQIEAVFKREIDEKFGSQYMQNFSTFLNNFPDPNEQDLFAQRAETLTTEQNNAKVVIGGQVYR